MIRWLLQCPSYTSHCGDMMEIFLGPQLSCQYCCPGVEESLELRPQSTVWGIRLWWQIQWPGEVRWGGRLVCHVTDIIINIRIRIRPDLCQSIQIDIRSKFLIYDLQSLKVGIKYYNGWCKYLYDDHFTFSRDRQFMDRAALWSSHHRLTDLRHEIGNFITFTGW